MTQKIVEEEVQALTNPNGNLCGRHQREVIEAQKLEIRKDNLVLGSDPADDRYMSISRETYVEKRLAPASERAAIAAQLEKQKRMLRATNLHMGNSQINYDSVARSAYTKHTINKTVNPNAAKEKADLRACHFDLGHENADEEANHYKTTNQVGMFEPLDNHQITSDNITKPCEGARGTNLLFGTDGNDYRSTAATDYKGVQSKVVFEDGRAKSLALRKSNLLLGNDDVDYTSSNTATFTKEVHELNKGQKAAPPPLRKTNFEFGYHDARDRTKFSEAQMAYGQLDQLLEACKNKSFAEGKDLRSHSYTLGTDSNEKQYLSVSQETYVEKKGMSAAEKKIEAARKAEIVKELRQTNIMFGDTSGRFEGKSLSREEFSKPDKKAYYGGGQSEEAKADLRACHWSFGADSDELAKIRAVGVTAQDFDDKSKVMEKAALSEAQKKDLRATHFHLGEDGRTTQSTQKSSYVSFPGARPAQIDPSLEADLRASHIKNGDDKHPEFVTSSGLAYVHHGSYEKIPMCAAARGSSINHGHDARVTASTAGASYLWPPDATCNCPMCIIEKAQNKCITITEVEDAIEQIEA